MDKKNRSSKSHEYINYYHQLGSYYHVDSDLFNMMMTNECFLNNTHKYRHIAILDNDEVIMPRVNNKILKVRDNFNFISSLSFNLTESKNNSVPNELTNLHSTCSKDMDSKFDNYLESFSKKPVTFHFNMGFYLREKQIKQIIESFEAYFNLNSFNITKTLLNEDKNIYKIQVIDLLPTQSDHNAYNFTFILNNKEDIRYAMNLCKIYRHLIGYFKRENKKDM